MQMKPFCLWVCVEWYALKRRSEWQCYPLFTFCYYTLATPINRACKVVVTTIKMYCTAGWFQRNNCSCTALWAHTVVQSWHSEQLKAVIPFALLAGVMAL